MSRHELATWATIIISATLIAAFWAGAAAIAVAAIIKSATMIAGYGAILALVVLGIGVAVGRRR